MSIYVIMAAGGSGTRMQTGVNKIFCDIQGQSVLQRSIRLFSGLIDGMTIVCRQSDYDRVRSTAEHSGVSFPVSFAFGGRTRQESVMNGLHALPAKPEDIVLVHDAARCLTPYNVINGVISSCRKNGSGVPAVPAVNTMKYCSSDRSVLSTVDRSGMYEIQTPQGFLFGSLLQAYIKAEKDSFTATDDASVMEHAGEDVHITEGTKMNLKITEKEDLTIASSLLNGSQPMFRIGTGYDVHRLAENRKLILCGVEIPYSLGLLGHSDADAGIHALMDAMLGALSLGDIGKHFPDSSEKYRNISSLILLKETYRMIREEGYCLENADVTIVAQKPKISPYIQKMKETVSGALECSPGQISIKATTTEELGFEGRKEGISAQAVCLLRKTT